MRHDIRTEADIVALAKHWNLPVPPLTTTPATTTISEVTDIGSIFDFAAQQIEFLVEGLIAAGTVNLISGEPGCGKTTLATALCSAVERGDLFAGLPTQRRPVLMLDRENPLPVVVERFKRLGIKDSPPHFTVWGGWNAEEPPAAQSPMVSRFVESCDPKPLILVDSLSAFHEGDENSATETREFFQGFRRLADLGATIIILHHSGKADSAQEYRGSSDIKAAIDTGFKLTNLGDPGRLATLRLKVFKSRFTVQMETIFHYVNDRFKVDDRPTSATNQELLQDVLIQNPGSATVALETLAVDKGVKRARVREVLDQWIQEAKVRVEVGEKNKKCYYWTGSPTDGFDDRL